jgi:hypothetical protein
VRRSGVDLTQQSPASISPPAPVPAPTKSLTLVETPAADPFDGIELVLPHTPVPTPPAFNRDEVIAEIKQTVRTLKFATTLRSWQEFERGLCGRPLTETTDAQLWQARDAIRKAAVNTEIIAWYAENWVGEPMQKMYLMGLIVMHAEVDGFEKTKAIVGNPANYRSPERIDMTAKNLLSWVRPDQLEEAA